MELVPLAKAQVVDVARSTPRYGHFLVSGVAPLAIGLRNGDSLDVSMVGTEGLLEALFLPGKLEVPSQTVMQVAGAAYRMPFSELKAEFLLSHELRALVMQNVQLQTLLTGQLAVCNHFHELEARLARWLLLMSDRAKSARFSLTHGLLAQVLGVRRPSLTLAATKMQREGTIRYQRGFIEIRDRRALQECACECYANISHLYLPMTAEGVEG